MSQSYLKYTLTSGKGGHALGEHSVVVYTKMIDDQCPSEDMIECVVNQRFTNPKQGLYQIRESIIVDLNDDQIARLYKDPDHVI